MSGCREFQPSCINEFAVIHSTTNGFRLKVVLFSMFRIVDYGMTVAKKRRHRRATPPATTTALTPATAAIAATAIACLVVPMFVSYQNCFRLQDGLRGIHPTRVDDVDQELPPLGCLLLRPEPACTEDAEPGLLG